MCVCVCVCVLGGGWGEGIALYKIFIKPNKSVIRLGNNEVLKT